MKLAVVQNFPLARNDALTQRFDSSNQIAQAVPDHWGCCFGTFGGRYALHHHRNIVLNRNWERETPCFRRYAR